MKLPLTERLRRGLDVLTTRAERIPGGLWRPGSVPRGFDPRQLAKGIAVEMEHTSDRATAREIALDHLTEDPRYYDKLERAGL